MSPFAALPIATIVTGTVYFAGWVAGRAHARARLKAAQARASALRALADIDDPPGRAVHMSVVAPYKNKG